MLKLRLRYHALAFCALATTFGIIILVDGHVDRVSTAYGIGMVLGYLIASVLHHTHGESGE